MGINVTSPQLCPCLNRVSCRRVSVVEVSQRGYCTPSAHIRYSLGWRVLNSRPVLSYLPWGIKLSFMTPSFGSADLFCWVDVYRFTEVASVLVATLMSPHAILLPNRHVIWFEVWSRHSIAAKIVKVTTSMVLAQNGVWWSVNVRDVC